MNLYTYFLLPSASTVILSDLLPSLPGIWYFHLANRITFTLPGYNRHPVSFRLPLPLTNVPLSANAIPGAGRSERTKEENNKGEEKLKEKLGEC